MTPTEPEPDPTIADADPARLDDLKDRGEAAADMRAFLRTSRDTHLSGTLSTAAVSVGFPFGATAPVPQGIPGYEILGELGRGGMGVVYKARQTGLKRVVALKMVLAGGHAGAERLARFRAEAEAVARLQHPGIVQVFDIGEYDGRPYFSMEFVDGPSLAQELARNLPPPRAAAALVAALAAAVQVAHQHGIIHRDLKPGNVLLGSDESKTPVGLNSSFSNQHSSFQPKIADFGLAKQVQSESDLTHTGAVVGTPCYMAPEQAAGDATKVGPPADVYALGAILYECLTGRPPFKGATMADTLDQVLRTDPLPPSRLQAGIPRDLEVVCLRCLRKELNRRYATASALADDLHRFLEGKAVLARPAGLAERGWRWCRRKPAVAALLAVVAATLLGGTAGVLYFAIRADHEADRANRSRVAAEGAAAKEAEANQQAQAAAEGLRRSLTRLHITAGNRFLEAVPPDRGSAVWWFTRAWDGDPADSQTEAAHRLRVGFALSQGPQLVGACFHRRPVTDALFDPSGKYVLTRTDESAAYLWDPFTGEQVAPPLEHPGPVRASAVRPSGGQAATGSDDGAVRLWDVPAGRLLRTIAQGGPVLFVSYERGGKVLVAATAVGAVHFWNPDTGEPAAPSLKVPAAVYYVGFSPDGRRAVTADAGHAARVWVVDTGKPAAGPFPHRDHRSDDAVAIAYCCWPAFHPNGSALAVVHPQTVVTVWNLDTAKPVGDPFKFRAGVHQVRFTPDGSRLLMHAGNTINALALKGGADPVRFVHPRESPRSCLSPDGKTLATCSTGGAVHLWDPVGNREISRPLRCADGIQSLAFSPDGRHLLAASHDGTARVWRIDGRVAGRKYAYDCGRADRLRVSDGKSRRVFDPAAQREVRFGGGAAELRDRAGRAGVPLPHPRPVIEARFTPDGRRVITRDEGETLRLWDAATGNPVGNPVALPTPLREMTPSADGGRLLTVERGSAAAGHERVVTVWEFPAGEPVFGPMSEWDSGPQVFDHPRVFRRISTAALSPDGTRAVLASDASGALGVWDVNAGKELARTVGYRGLLYGLRFTPDGKRFLTHGSDTIARLWDTATAAPAGPPLRHPRFCSLADVSADGGQVVTVDSSAVVRLWDGLTGDQFGRFDTPEKLVIDAAWFAADGRRLVLNHGAVVVDLPSYRGSAADLRPLLHLLTGFDQDPDDNIGEVGQHTFLGDPDRYRRVWREWVKHRDNGLPRAPDTAAK